VVLVEYTELVDVTREYDELVEAFAPRFQTIRNRNKSIRRFPIILERREKSSVFIIFLEDVPEDIVL